MGSKVLRISPENAAIAAVADAAIMIMVEEACKNGGGDESSIKDKDVESTRQPTPQ